MATTDIQNSVYKTIDVIVKKRIEDLHLDKTIECIVENCVDLETGKYRVKYGAGFFDAYSINKEVYFPNTAIYVLVPENNFNNKKTIIGKVSSGLPTSSDEETDSSYTDYNIIGKNILVPKISDEYFKINSTSTQEYQKILYDINTPEENLLTVDTNSLSVYLKETQAFRLSGKFKTNAKTKTGRESFGLTFTFTQKTANTNYKTMQARWEAEAEQAKAFVEVEKDKIEERTLQYYYNIVKNNVFNNMADKSVIAVQNELSDIVSELQLFKTGISKENKDGLELTDLYIQLLTELANYTVNANNNAVTKEDIVSQFNSWFTGVSYGYEKKVVSYSLTSNIMTGNPYHYSNANGSYQYFFVDIDPEKFVSLDQVLFYSDFTRDDSSAEEDLWVKDVSLECIKYVTNTNEDYRLSLSYSDIYFDESASDDTKITVSAKLIYQDNNDVTQYSRFLWFKKNSNIKSTDLKYNNYGGEGWEHITDSLNTALYDRSSNLDLYVKDNKIYRNQYKVVAMYDSSLPIEQKFTIYNEKHNHDIELTAPSGLYFRKEVNGVKEIICKIDGSDTPPSTDYVFKWFANDIEIKPQAEIKAWRDKISIEKDKNVKNREQAKLNLVGTILWDKEKTPNIIQVPNIIEYSEIEGQVTITCQIFVLDENNQENEFDVISVILKNEESLPVYLKANYVEIENGDQVFQYNEMGISPASARYENPQVPKQLSCKLYDPAGGYIDRLKYYEVSWEVPIENTLIRVDNSLLQTGSSGLKNKVVGEVLNFSIADEYDYNATNNQIICEIKMVQDGQPVPYRQSTNFFFGKVGEDGTNGTDVVAKISPININDTLAKEVLTLNINKTDIDNIKTEWNNGVTTDINANNQDGILQLQLFRNNDLIDPSEYKHVSWSILNNGLTSKHWGTHTILENNSAPKASLVYKEEKSPRAYTNYVIKGQADLKVNNTENDSEETKYQTYFGFYPICTITQYAADLKYNVGIDKARTLRHIMYNSDGRFPQYNKNLGVGLTFTNKDSNSSKYFGDDTSRTIVWEAHGGIIQGEYQENNPAFSIGRTKTWVPSIEGQTEDKISELEETKKKTLTTLIAIQKNNCISTDIPATLNNIKTQINNQKVEINKKLNSLKFNVNTLWTNFKDTQLKKKEAAWDILKSYSGDIDIKSYIYKGEQKYFDDKNKTSFKEYVDDYVEAMLTNDSIRRNPFNNSSIVSPKILTSDWLSFSVKNVSKDIELAFQNLIITITIGYKANLIVYDSAGDSDSLLNQVDELEKELEKVNKELDNYNSITPEDIAGKIDSENKNPRAEKIKAIIFENDTITDEDGISQTLFNLILRQKEIYNQQILDASEKLDFQINYLKNELDKNADPTFCSILPNEIYNGEFTNQYVKASIYKDETLEYEIIVPIHMYLNLYGLGLLNSWDGNGIEINNDGEYILAPQIGAGQKNSDNTFTGLLMGTKKESEQSGVIGLFGYNQGRQSIALNSETGSAVFGLPEQQGSLTDGRIELIPGGTSSISQWKVDARSLYNILPSQETDILITTGDAHITEEPTDERLLGPRYNDAPQFAHGSIPHDKQGILFSALPPYASFKGRQLNASDHEQKKVNFLNLNTTAREGDSFELQIDPNDSKFFTLYEHSYRLKYGETFCDQWKNFGTNSLYDFSAKEVSGIRAQIEANDKTKDYNISENDYIICQLYYTNSGRQLHVLSLLKFVTGDKAWMLLNPVYQDANNLSEEYVVGELYQYENWNTSSRSSVWKFITFTDNTQIIKIDSFSLNDSDGGKSFNTLTVKEENIQNKVWKRHRKAGIDATGKFTAESLGVGSLGMGLGDIRAFNNASYFVGTSLESDNSPIIQFFADKQGIDIGDTGPVYISSSKDLGTDEGKRPIRIYAGVKSPNYNESVFGNGTYKSGIFVGKNSIKDPIKNIAKIELWQTNSSNDDNIVLSALGNDTNHQSVFTLSSNQAGGLNHTNDWTTTIGGALTKTITGNWDQTAKNKFKLNTVLGIRVTALNNRLNISSGYDDGTVDSGLQVTYQTTNSTKLNNFILNENSKFDVCRTMQFFTRGRSGNEPGNDGTGMLMSAENTNGGILLRTTAAEQFDGNYSGIATAPGVASLLLRPSAGNSDAPGEFYLQGGQATNDPNSRYKNNLTRVFSSHEQTKSGGEIVHHWDKAMVIIEPRLDVKSGSTPGPIVAGSLELQKQGTSTGDISAAGNVGVTGNINAAGNIQATGKDKWIWGTALYAGEKSGDWYKGKIYGDGSEISNTCNGGGATPGGGGTITLGSSEGVSITIPKISVSNGRPSFSTSTITIKAGEPNSNKWATRQWVIDSYATKTSAVKKAQVWAGSTSFTYDEKTIQSTLNIIASRLDALRDALNTSI